MADSAETQSMPLLPPEALKALAALEQAGFEAWVVGGCVRDALLGRPVNDYDIATSAPWQESERILSEASFAVHRTGTAHGTVTATLGGWAFEVTTYRTESGYADGRHPDAVSFVQSIQEDLARRDFTINAMAFHPDRGLLDLYGGLDDLRSGTLRTVGDPGQRFSEDGLRILRGLRFASQLGFRIEPGTFQAMTACKMMLANVSAERIVHEMDGLLMGGYAHDGLMAAIDVLGAIMPEIVACKGFDQHTPYHIYDVWEHTAWAVQHAPATRLGRWSAFFHDVGKPGAFFMEGERGHFYGHGKLSVTIAGEIMERLRFSSRMRDQVLTLVRIHDHQIEPTARSVKRALAKLDGDTELFRTLLGLKRADALAQSDLGAPRLELADRIEGILEELLAADEAFTVRQLAIGGNDVLALGVEPGPAVGELLASCLQAVIDEDVANEREALLAFARARA